MSSVPPGPGVQPPFPAPPSEGRGNRIGWALGITGAALVLCCGGGAVAALGFGVTQTAALEEQSRVVMTKYLDAVMQAKYDKAYDYLCDPLQESLSRSAFASGERAEGKLTSYTLGAFDFQNLDLRVSESYVGKSTTNRTYHFEPDKKTAQLEICNRK